jgi:hypothetical protein
MKVSMLSAQPHEPTAFVNREIGALSGNLQILEDVHNVDQKALAYITSSLNSLYSRLLGLDSYIRHQWMTGEPGDWEGLSGQMDVGFGHWIRAARGIQTAAHRRPFPPEHAELFEILDRNLREAQAADFSDDESLPEAVALLADQAITDHRAGLTEPLFGKEQGP